MISEESVYETSDADLGAFLLIEGIKYMGCRIERNSKSEKIAVMRFHDEKSNCRDLEQVFINSREKKYREMNKYLLKDIHKEMKVRA